MNGILRMVLVLVAISAVSAIGLSWVDALTAERIRDEIRQDTRDAIERVSPPFDNLPVREIFKVNKLTYFPVKQKGELLGFAVRVRSKAGYSGDIVALVGVALDGTVNGVEILAHAETPGLGAKFTEPEFLAQFPGRSLHGATWKVKKDGGDFDQITGATITPRALLQAVEAGLQSYQRDREQVLAAARKAGKRKDSRPTTPPANAALPAGGKTKQ